MYLSSDECTDEGSYRTHSIPIYAFSDLLCGKTVSYTEERINGNVEEEIILENRD